MKDQYVGKRTPGVRSPQSKKEAGVQEGTSLITCPRDFSISSYRLRPGWVYTFGDNRGTKTAFIAAWRDSMNLFVHAEWIVFVAYASSRCISFLSVRSLSSHSLRGFLPSHTLSIARLHHNAVTIQVSEITGLSRSARQTFVGILVLEAARQAREAW